MGGRTQDLPSLLFRTIYDYTNVKVITQVMILFHEIMFAYAFMLIAREQEFASKSVSFPNFL